MTYPFSPSYVFKLITAEDIKRGTLSQSIKVVPKMNSNYNLTSTDVSLINLNIQDLLSFLDPNIKRAHRIQNLFDAQTKLVTTYLQFKEIKSQDELVNLWLKKTWIILNHLMIKLEMAN